MPIVSFKHSFHIVDPSPWPLMSALAALFTTYGGVAYMHGYANSNHIRVGLYMVLYTMYFWWRDVIRESLYKGRHVSKVQHGIKIGFLLFIVSEIMFFVAFFWGFFHFSLNPSVTIGAVWPPAHLEVLDPKQVPLLNTFILLTSGATITWAHNAILWGSKEQAIYGFIATILLAIIFTCCQVYEYISTTYTISDSVYGAIFYMATGFHGFHVFHWNLFYFYLCNAFISKSF